RDARPEIRIEALGALVLVKDPRTLAILRHVAGTDPARWMRARAVELLGTIEGGRAAAADVAAAATAITLDSTALHVHALLALARRRGASDLHVSVDSPPALRVHGVLTRLDDQALTAEQVDALLLPLLTADQ